MSRYFRAEIAENISLNKDYNLITFIPLADTREPEPGQFYMIGSYTAETGSPAKIPPYSNICDPLLKRPFSIFRKIADGFQILCRIKGKGTTIIRNMRKGMSVDVLGPLGSFYPMPSGNRPSLIVAGGLGIASVFFLAERIVQSGDKANIYYGARTETDLIMIDELRGITEGLSISTDDGSCGERGCVTDMFGDFLSCNPSLTAEAVIYACGPAKMLETISSIARARRIAAYISLEERMACGIGACLGCVVKTVEGYKRVCKEGPVFRAEEIVWGEQT